MTIYDVINYDSVRVISDSFIVAPWLCAKRHVVYFTKKKYERYNKNTQDSVTIKLIELNVYIYSLRDPSIS